MEQDPRKFFGAGPFYPRPQGFDITRGLFYEGPSADASHLEVWTYTDRWSYAPGDSVQFHISSSASRGSLEIFRDGAQPQSVHKAGPFPLSRQTLPEDFYSKGCGWPVAYRWQIPQDLPSGYYLVITRVEDERGTREQEHGFYLLAAQGRRRSNVLFLAPVCTLNAYNDWGGSSNYYSSSAPDGLPFSPRVSIQRPLARGFVWLPEGAPRKPLETPPAAHSLVRYPFIEFAYARGFSRFYANAGWATYERPFICWAESQGYEFDYATQLDLHARPDLLDGYRCVVIVGHDEYWTGGMRDAIERFVEGGGNVARFAGDFGYQIRLEEDGAAQVCYKELARTHDPLATSDPSRMTAMWDDPWLQRPAAATLGLSCVYGVYAGYGACVPRGPGGFTVYRPEHWAFEGTDLYYGDVFGSQARIFGYELDGLDYEIRDGLPFPTYRDGAQPGTQILAMGLATTREDVRGRKGEVSYLGDASVLIAPLRYGDSTVDSQDKASRGAGMVACVPRGKGTIFNAGTCEWVAGLKAREPMTETITHNVLRRFSRS